jgi:hypothetical protein
MSARNAWFVSEAPPRAMGVSIRPGATLLTVMPSGPSSTASERARLINPLLEAA